MASSLSSFEKTPADTLCDFLSAFKRKTAQQPTVDELHSELYTVNDADRLSAIKSHNLLGTILCTFASDGRQAHARCVIESLNQSDRLSVYQLSDCGKNTLMHHAAYNGHANVIRFVLSSLESDNEKLSLLRLANASGYTTLDCAVHDKQPEAKMRAVRKALLDPLPHELRRTLIEMSFVFLRNTSDDVINQLTDPGDALLEISQNDEAAPVEEIIVENHVEVVETHPVQADQGPRLAELESQLADERKGRKNLMKRMRQMERMVAGLTAGYCNLKSALNRFRQGEECTQTPESAQDESSFSGDSLPSSVLSSLSPMPEGAQFLYNVPELEGDVEE